MPGRVAALKNFSADSQGKKPPQARHLTLRNCCCCCCSLGPKEEVEVEEGEEEEEFAKGTSTRPVPAQTAHRRWIRILLPNSQEPSAKTSVGSRAPSQISGPGV